MIILNPNYELLLKYYSNSNLRGLNIRSVKYMDEPTHSKILALCVEYGLQVHVDNFSVISIVTSKLYQSDRGLDKLQPEFVEYTNERIRLRDFINKIESFEYKKPYIWDNEFSYPYSNSVKQIVIKTKNVDTTLTIESNYMIQEVLTYLRGLKAKSGDKIKRIYDYQIKSKNIKIASLLLHFYLQNYTILKAKTGKKTSAKQRAFIGKLLIITQIPEFIERYEQETFAAKTSETYSIEAYVNTLLRDGLKYIDNEGNTK